MIAQDRILVGAAAVLAKCGHENGLFVLENFIALFLFSKYSEVMKNLSLSVKVKIFNRKIKSKNTILSKSGQRTVISILIFNIGLESR